MENVNLNNLQCVRGKAGVYCLFKKIDNLDFCVYVGQSTNIYVRILEHIAEGKKDFDFFKSIEVNQDYARDAIEARLIYSCAVSSIFKFYNIDVKNNIKNPSIEDLLFFEKNQIFNQYQSMFPSKNNFLLEMDKIWFINLYYSILLKAATNSIKLEKDYEEDELMDGVLDKIRIKNEYTKLKGGYFEVV